MRMSYYEFSNNVKFVFGDDDFSKTVSIMKQNGAKKIFIISEKEISSIDIMTLLCNVIDKNNLSKSKISIVDSKIASLDDVMKAYDEYRNQNCDSILAVGGETVVEVAKGLRLTLATKTREILYSRGMDCYNKLENVPFGVISTSIGAGNEASKILVLFDKRNQKLYQYISELVQPNFCSSTSQYALKNDSKDIYLELMRITAECIDSYISIKSNIMTKNMIRSILFHIKQTLRIYKKSSSVADSDEISRETIEKSIFDLQRACILTGAASSNSDLALISAVVNALVIKLQIPAKEIIPSVIVGCLEYNMEKVRKEYSEMYLALVGSNKYSKTEREKRPEAFVNLITTLVRLGSINYSIKTNLSSLGVREEMLEEIASYAMSQRFIITNPKHIDKTEIISLLRSML